MAYLVKSMMTHIGIVIINKENNSYWTYWLSHMVMNYLEKNMNLDDTIAKV